LIQNLYKFLLFFRPIKASSQININDRISYPFVASFFLSLLSSFIYNRIGIEYLHVSLNDIIIETLSPLLIAVTSHFIITFLFKVAGSQRRLIVQFYYAFVGFLFLNITIAVVFLLFIESINVALVISIPLSLYYLIVTVILLKENYSISLGKSLIVVFLMLSFLFVLFLIVYWTGKIFI